MFCFWRRRPDRRRRLRIRCGHRPRSSRGAVLAARAPGRSSAVSRSDVARACEVCVCVCVRVEKIRYTVIIVCSLRHRLRCGLTVRFTPEPKPKTWGVTKYMKIVVGSGARARGNLNMVSRALLRRRPRVSSPRVVTHANADCQSARSRICRSCRISSHDLQIVPHKFARSADRAAYVLKAPCSAPCICHQLCPSQGSPASGQGEPPSGRGPGTPPRE